MDAKTKPNWLEIQQDYISSNISYREIAVKYGISFNTLKSVAIREDWFKKRNKLTSKVKANINKKNEELAEVIAEKIIDRNQIHLETWDLLINRTLDALRTNKVSRVVDKTIQTTALFTDDIEKLSRTLDKAQRGQRLALGLDKDDDKEKQQSALEVLLESMNRAANAGL